MTEPGGERRQQPLDVGALPVPRLQPVNGRGMAQGVKARGSLPVAAPDSGLPEQLGERGPDGASDHGCAIAVGEEGGGRAVRQRPLGTLGGIGPQRISELRTDVNEAGLVELGVCVSSAVHRSGRHRRA